MVSTDGLYIYGIVNTNQRQEFDLPGIGGRGDRVYTLPYQAIAAIVSSSPMKKYAVTRENSMAHMKVLERAMEEYTVLPVRFCTIADREEVLIEKVLQGRYDELTMLLRETEGKIELGVRVRWNDLNAVFAQITEENEDIKKMKSSLLSEENEQVKYAGMIRIGQMVQNALEEKKRREAHDLLEALIPLSLDYKENQIYGDMNIISAAFLLEKENERYFDEKIRELEKEYGEGKKIKYIGPVVPYNFVEVVITW